VSAWSEWRISGRSVSEWMIRQRVEDEQRISE
jgi:hypothetical protein